MSEVGPATMRYGTDWERLFNPRGIAIVGASRDLRRIGGQPVDYLSRYGYPGRVYPVNPRYDEIAGLRCYRSVSAIDGPCDVALVAVNARSTPEVIRECGLLGIRFAVIFSSGFREVGSNGAALEQELLHSAREHGVRLIGPNCQGYLNLAQRMYATFGVLGLEPDLKAGSVSIVSQSGGFGFGIVTECESAGIGFRRIVSSGNESDITTPEILDAFVEDEGTQVLVGYVEGVRDGRALMQVARRATDAGKPLLMWKTGNSEVGKRASLSHTANMTGSYDVYQAAYRQAGILEVGDISEISDCLRAFLGGRLPKGGRVAALGSSAGSCILFADRCAALGLEMAELSPETEAALAQVLPPFGSPRNPVDVTADVFNDLSSFGRAVDLVLADPNVDLLGVLYAGLSGEIALACNSAVAAAVSRSGKPAMLAWTARRHRAESAYALADREGIPYFASPVRLANAASMLTRHAMNRARAATRTLFASTPERTWPPLPEGTGAMSESASKRILSDWGIPVTNDVLVGIGRGLEAAVRHLKFPLAVKVVSADIPHKTEAGAVALGIESLRRLEACVAQIVESARAYKPDARIEGVLVSEMITDGVEMLVGVTKDPVFGPTVALGLGGVQAELLRDMTYRIAPFDEDTAREMLGELRGSRLLAGFRNRAPADVDALVAAIASLSHAAWAYRERLVELDVNPLFVRPRGHGVVAADALMVLGS